jgi:hypothetical protein
LLIENGQGAAPPEGIKIMGEDEYKAAVAAFISSKGVTRCPTACALPTQGTVAASDRAALESYAIARALSRRRRQAARMRSFWAAPAAAD